MRIRKGTKFIEEDQQPEEVFFLLTGAVLRQSKEEEKYNIKPTYLIEGSVFGEVDMLSNKPRKQSYTAVCDCYVLKLAKTAFRELLESFVDFRLQIYSIAQDREV